MVFRTALGAQMNMRILPIIFVFSSSTVYPVDFRTALLIRTSLVIAPQALLENLFAKRDKALDEK